MINSSTACFLSHDSMGCLGDSTHLSKHHSQDCIYVTDWLGPGLSGGCRPRHIDLNRRQPLHVAAVVRGSRQHSQKKVAKSGKRAVKSFLFVCLLIHFFKDFFFNVDHFQSFWSSFQYRFSSTFWVFGEACGILAPWPAIEPAPPALEGKVLSTGRPGKSLVHLLNGALRPVSHFTGQSKS